MGIVYAHVRLGNDAAPGSKETECDGPGEHGCVTPVHS